MQKPSIITGIVQPPNPSVAYLDFMDAHDGNGNMLIASFIDSDFKIINQVAYRQGKVVTLSDMSRNTGLSEARALIAVERLIESGLISLSTPIDDFIALNQQGKSPIFTLHLENVPQAIKYFQSIKRGK